MGEIVRPSRERTVDLLGRLRASRPELVNEWEALIREGEACLSNEGPVYEEHWGRDVLFATKMTVYFVKQGWASGNSEAVFLTNYVEALLRIEMGLGVAPSYRFLREHKRG